LLAEEEVVITLEEVLGLAAIELHFQEEQNYQFQQVQYQ
jgi:hypothetical protein